MKTSHESRAALHLMTTFGIFSLILPKNPAPLGVGGRCARKPYMNISCLHSSKLLWLVRNGLYYTLWVAIECAKNGRCY